MERDKARLVAENIDGEEEVIEVDRGKSVNKR